MAFMDWNGTIGTLVLSSVETTTGSLILSLLILMVFILAIALVFGIKLEYTSILILPLVLGYTSYYGDFVALLFTILVYIAFIITKNFIFSR